MSLDKKLSRLEAELEKLRRRVKGVEDLKVASEVFDRATLLTLYELANRGYIDVMQGVIKTGKESNVFFARDREGNALAVKIHRVATSDFKAMTKYIEGDPRFPKMRRSRRGIVYTWVRKEFKNLERAHLAGVRVPRPVAFRNNVLVMEFIGEDGLAAPMLRQVELSNPEEFFRELLENVRRLYCRAKLVHADLSEYNILVKEERPVIIDLSSGVMRDHPHAEEFFARDVANLVRYFRRYFSVDYNEVYGYIASCGGDHGVPEDSQG
jgi:RIO kinase 1